MIKMILKNNWQILVVFFFILNTTSFIAQNTELSEKVLQHLTLNQQEMLEEQQKFIDRSKLDFKNSLSVEQKNILRNKNISKDERSRLLKASFSNKQRDLIQSNKNLLRNKRLTFKRSLNRRQVTRLRRFISDRDIHDRKRLVRRIRRLIRDNLNTDNI